MTQGKWAGNDGKQQSASFHKVLLALLYAQTGSFMKDFEKDAG